MIDIPSASDLSTQALADIEGAIGQSVPLQPKSFIRVLARTLGTLIADLYRLTRWTYEQIFPETADLEALTRIGSRYGLGQHPAVAAVLDIQVIGEPGATLKGGAIWTGPNGLAYTQYALVEIGALGVGTARVECLTGGSDGTLGVGNALTLATGSSTGQIDGSSVLAIQIEGEDAETTEDFRARVAQRLAGQPQGGSAADYIAWAMQIPGVIRAFAFRTATGTVTVYPLVATTGPDRLPSASKIAEVLAYIDNPARRPLCATVLVAALTERTVDVTITSLNPGDATTKAAIQAEIERYLYAAYPRQYPDEENPTNVISVDAVRAAIFASGAASASTTMSVSGTGAVTRYELASGEIVKLGTLTWA